MVGVCLNILNKAEAVYENSECKFTRFSEQFSLAPTNHSSFYSNHEKILNRFLYKANSNSVSGDAILHLCFSCNSGQ